MLMETLKILNFTNFPAPKSNNKPDKLFCLGDRSNRDEGSFDIMQSFKYISSYFSLCGNHEKMAYRGTIKDPFKCLTNIVYQGHDRTF